MSHYPPPPWWTHYPPPYPHPSGNGNSLDMGRSMGRMEAEADRHTEMLAALLKMASDLRSDIQALPDRLVARMPPPALAATPVSPPTPAAPTAPPDQSVPNIERWAKLVFTIVLPLSGLVLIALGKVEAGIGLLKGGGVP